MTPEWALKQKRDFPYTFKAPYSVIYSLKGNPQALIEWDTARINKSRRTRARNKRRRELIDWIMKDLNKDKN
jgi:hypothetical protein